MKLQQILKKIKSIVLDPITWLGIYFAANMIWSIAVGDGLSLFLTIAALGFFYLYIRHGVDR